MSTAMIWQTRTRSSDDTVAIGEQFGKLIKAPAVLELRSDLGGGKTTFARGLAKGLGVKEPISSPSFTLSREYRAKSGIKLYHFDFYRLSESGVLADQLAEAVSDQQGIVVVEWSDIVQDVLPAEHTTIEFRPIANNPDEREVTFHYFANQFELIEKLRTAEQGIKP